MAEKKERQKGKREKQMEELKAGRNGELCTGGMDGWVAAGWTMENLFVPRSSAFV